MPVYDYLCPCCGRRQDDIFVHRYDREVKCVQCKGKMKRLISTRVRADVFPEKGVYLEHVSAEGKTFYSKKEMRQYEKDHDVELAYLL